MRVMRLLLFLIPSVFYAAGTASAWAEPIAIVVNKSNASDDLSTLEIARIFEAKMNRWQDGTKIVPVNREFAASIREAFSESVHSKSVEKMRAYWYDQQYHGIVPPMTQESSVAVKRFVARVPGAIGYIYLKEVDDTVKVIKVDGLSCQDSGYKLQER